MANANGPPRILVDEKSLECIHWTGKRLVLLTNGELSDVMHAQTGRTTRICFLIRKPEYEPEEPSDE